MSKTVIVSRDDTAAIPGNISAAVSSDDILDRLSGPIIYTLTNAYLFVAVLQKNQEALCYLIAALLRIQRSDILSLEILNPIILGQNIERKDCVLDLLVLLNNNTKVNLEIQVRNEGNWDDRGVYYLAQNLCDLKSGEDYTSLKGMIQIGILDFNFPADNQEFYQEYLMMNIRTHRIFSDKMRLNVLCLNQLENATEEDRSSGLYEWAKTFKATTWEELKRLSKDNEVIRNTVVTMAQLSDDEKIREQCRRREKFERDQLNFRNYCLREGIEVGRAKGLEEGRAKGLEEGRTEGKEEGAALLGDLIMKLIAAGRADEIERVSSDPGYRNALYKEFHLEG